MVFYEPTHVSGTLHMKHGKDKMFKKFLKTIIFPLLENEAYRSNSLAVIQKYTFSPFQFSFKFTSYNFHNTPVSHLGIKILIL